MPLIRTPRATQRTPLNSSRSLILRQRSKSQIRLHNPKLWEQSLGLLILNTRVDDNILTRNPVDRSSDAVLVTSLKGVDDTKDLSGVAAGGGGVGEDETDGFLGVDDEDGADGEGDSFCVDVGGVLVVEPVFSLISPSPSQRDLNNNKISTIIAGYLHVIGVCNLSALIPNNWERKLAPGNLINILDPSSVRLNRVGGEPNQLDTTLGELRLEFGKGAQLGGADGSIILGVGEEDDPFVSDELVEVDWASGRLGSEVWGDGSEAETVVGIVSLLSSKQIGLWNNLLPLGKLFADERKQK